MIEPAQDSSGDDLADGQGVVVRRAFRDGLTDPLMSSALTEIAHVLSDKSSHVLLAEQQHMVEALAPETAVKPLAEALVHSGWYSLGSGRIGRPRSTAREVLPVQANPA